MVSVLLLTLLPEISFGQNDKKNDSLSREIKPLQQPKSSSVMNSTEAPLKNITVKSDGVQTISSGTPRTQPTIDQKIASIEDHIKAIDIKVAHVSADPALNQKAIEQNWFEQMVDIRVKLVQQRDELVIQKNN